MTVELVRDMLAWCTVINMGLLIWWALFIMFARAFVYRLHGKLFPMSEERFNAIHYTGMAYYKIAIFLFNLGPYIALRIVA